jgi:hypothetical protein
MTNHISKLLAVLILASALPLAAQDASSIRAALSSQNYGRAIGLTKQAFVNVKTAAEASTLLQQIISAAPADQVGPLVVAAVEGNPDLGEAIIYAAVKGVPKDESTEILTEAYFALSQNPAVFAPLLTYISDLLGETLPLDEVLKMPWFNPANPTPTVLSPSTPTDRDR